MADLTTAAVSSAAASVGAVTLAIFGLPPGAMFYGFVGAGFGVSLSKPAGRWLTCWAFLFSMFGGALVGVLAGPHLTEALAGKAPEAVCVNVVAMVVATLGQQAQAFIAGRLAPLLGRVAAALGFKR